MGSAHITWTHEEPIGIVPVEVEYTIYASVSPVIPATFYDPAEGGEVEITDVIRHDPVTKETVTLAEEDWPFSDKELQKIYDALGQSEVEVDYPDPPDDDYDPFD